VAKNINPATGRDRSQDARLNALRDREVSRMAAEARETRQRIQRTLSRRKAGQN
jgi:hypothetical protein